MSVSGPCEICTVSDVRHTCNRCAMLVCDRHYDDETGYCVECAAEVGRTNNRSDEDEELPDGVDTYRF